MLNPTTGETSHDLRSIRSDLPPPPKGDKRMPDSFCEVLLPFCEDAELRDAYVSIHGGLRFGKLMEDLDVLAASIAYLHCDDADLAIVTAAVDRIDLLKNFDRVQNVRMRGSVTYVGRSSMEITIAVEMEEPKGGAWELAALAKFVFAARSADGSRSVPVNRLLLQTDSEKELFRIGEARHKYRLSRSEQSLFRQPPTAEESLLLHTLLVRKSTPTAANATQQRLVPINDTKTSSIRICHPQERNIHNFVFGGYLMREAFELAYSTAFLFTHGKPLLITTVDDLSFVYPVAIGSLLNLTACIVYTDRDPASTSLHRLHVEVIADVVDPVHASRLTTNTFHFTFSCAMGHDAAAVTPKTYTEAMRYLEGKRRLALGDHADHS